MILISLLVGALSALVLFATWFGYPWCISRIAARTSATEKAPPGSFLSVSVVLATRESNEAIHRRIANIFDTEYDGQFEVIVGIDASTERITPSELESVRFIAAEVVAGKASALNAAVELATGEVLIFADTYQLFDRQTIPELLAGFHHPSVAAVSGLLRLPSDGETHGRGPLDWYWSMERRLRSNEARIHSTVGVTGAVYALRREDWRPLRTGLILDDVFTPMRLVLDNRRIHFTDTALAYEMRTPSDESQYQRKVRTLTGVVQLCVWLRDVLLPWRNPIWIQFVCHKLLRLVSPFCLIAIALSALLLMMSHETSARLALVALAAGVLGLMIPLGPIKKIRNILLTLSLTQLATLTAVSNGFRRRWNVW